MGHSPVKLEVVDIEARSLDAGNWNQQVGTDQGDLVGPNDTPVNFEDLTQLLSAWTGPGPDASPEAA